MLISFIGWILLGAITFGIAFIWVIPYMEATYANAYNSLKSALVEVVNEPTVISAEETPEN